MTHHGHGRRSRRSRNIRRPGSIHWAIYLGLGVLVVAVAVVVVLAVVVR